MQLLIKKIKIVKAKEKTKFWIFLYKKDCLNLDTILKHNKKSTFSQTIFTIPSWSLLGSIWWRKTCWRRTGYFLPECMVCTRRESCARQYCWLEWQIMTKNVSHVAGWTKYGRECGLGSWKVTRSCAGGCFWTWHLQPLRWTQCCRLLCHPILCLMRPKLR